jgi:4-hydroxy-2-oxoheptanedioate aldolase
MPEVGRLNKIIGALEQGQPAFVTWATPEVSSAISLSTSPYDGIVFEMEGNPWDIRVLRDCLQYMLSPRHYATSGSVAPAVAPLVRIPPNGGEMNQFFAKQALGVGVYGLVWPHISNVREAYNAVASCRYTNLPGSPRHEPVGTRNFPSGAAARYWGLGIDNLSEILKEVPGIGVILVGAGDLSQVLGHPLKRDHPDVMAQIARIVDTCKEFAVPVGYPEVGLPHDNEQLLALGYRFLMPRPSQSYAPVQEGLKLAGRSS